MKDEHAAL